ncbi:type VI secretion system membrane subunit TssM [Saccharospirillum salsuginis]|uniref:Type VI secretion system protein ImpL n=1 Tax=Saccharospirillum salsuginis TaxID=418750 RepID=A0A918K0Y0_9GAMM|nr:type VI secretion system membrane subunit TssM [Saccharospirillum salsuginis]GGX39326.1 type VI secretion system protein ImpL [Saccharospirillum salsuginis]
MGNTILMKLKGLLLSKASGWLAGIAAVLVLIWYLGHYVGLNSQRLKFMAMAAVIGVFLLFLVLRFLYNAVRGKRLRQQLDKMGDDQSSDSIQNKISDVLSALKSSHLGTRYRGNSALYALPWYMVIGPSAAGKSTLFSRSGLEFPLKDDQRFHVQGIGGTRDCDWWFSDQAILIDTAGRYTSDDENDDWLNFLRVLKANRSRMPINGLMLALPLDQILTSDKDTLEQHAKHLKNRLHELISELGVTFPIYIVITKSDLLKGFEAYFGDLGDGEVKQPWGVYLLDETEDRSSNALGVLEERLNQLYHRLLEQRSQKINLAGAAEDKVEIYQFPNQFAGAVEKLMDLLALLFKDNPYHESPWFAGVYFTSSTQEGVALERKSNAFKSIFARVTAQAKERAGESRSYFIDRLFTDVIFPLKDAVRGNRKRQRWDRLGKATTFVLIAGLLTVTGVGLFSTYTANRLLISDYQKKAETLLDRYHDSEVGEQERLDALVGLYEHYRKLEDMQTYSPVQLVRRYSLVESHAEPMHRLLLDTVTGTLHDRVVPSLQTELNRYGTAWTEWTEEERIARQQDYYQALRAYLMMTSHRERQDEDFLETYLSKLWYDTYTETDLLLSYQQQQPVMQEMVRFYLTEVFADIEESHTNPWLAGNEVVEMAQSNLATEADAEMLYNRLVASANGRFDDVIISDILADAVSGALRAEEKVPGIYTRDAWQSYVAEEIDTLAKTASTGDWVLGMETESENSGPDDRLKRRLRSDLRQLYFARYADAWTQFLSSVRVPAFRDLTDSVRTIKALGHESAPWASLFDRVALELSLTEPMLEQGSQMSDLANQVTGEDESEEPAPIPIIPAFERQAKTLFELVQPKQKASANPVWTSYQQELQALAGELEFMLAASDIHREAKDYAKELLAGDSNGKQLYAGWIAINGLLQEMKPGSREWVANQFRAPLQYTWYAMLGSANQALQQQWESRVYRAYSNDLQGRFPFSTSQVEATPHDVKLLLQPEQGTLWRFMDEELQPFLKKSGGRWQSRTWLNRGLAFNPGFFQALQGADRIASGLFKPGTGEMGMGYALYPMPVPGVTESLIEVDGSHYRYRNEPQEWREFSWTLSKNDSFARVMARAGNQVAPATLEATGQWAFVRLIQQADVTHLRGTEFELHWQLDNEPRPASVRFRMRADREGSVLNANLFSQLSLPRNLFQAG